MERVPGEILTEIQGETNEEMWENIFGEILNWIPGIILGKIL